jgi:hypothetical protein
MAGFGPVFAAALAGECGETQAKTVYLREKGQKWRKGAAWREGVPGMGMVEDYNPHRAFFETV